MSEVELVDFAAESLPPEPLHSLNRLQKKMLKYLMFGEGSSNGTGSHELRLRVLYRMIEAGVFNAGISFDETRDRMDEWRNPLGDSVDWCGTGEQQFKRAMKSGGGRRREPRDGDPMDGGRFEYRSYCNCDRCEAHRRAYLYQQDR